MSLEDKFYPEDGSILTKFDNSMIKSSGKIGEAYQHLTGKSYKGLVKNSYKISAIGFGLSLFGLRLSAILFGGLSLAGAYYPDYKSPLEEEIQEESWGINRKSGKLIRTCMLASAPIIISYGLVLANKDSDENSRLLIYSGLGGIVEGASLVPYNFAEYLTKADIPEPPKKTIWERAGNKIKGVFSPNLIPEPVPANYLNSVSSD